MLIGSCGSARLKAVHEDTMAMVRTEMAEQQSEHERVVALQQQCSNAEKEQMAALHRHEIGTVQPATGATAIRS